MRLVIELQPVNNISLRLPLEYNHFVQSAIYRTLDADFGDVFARYRILWERAAI